VAAAPPPPSPESPATSPATHAVPGVHPSSDRESPPTARVLSVLEYLAVAPARAVTPADLVRELGITRSTSRLILSALARGGYAHRDDSSGKFRIGPAAIALGRAARERTPLCLVVSGVLQRVADDMRVSCSINTRVGDDFFVLERIGAPNVHADPFGRAGVRLPFAAPLGAPFAAFAPDQQRERWFERGKVGSEQRDRWEAILESIRHDGYHVRVLASGLQADMADVLDQIVAFPGPSTAQHAEALADMLASLRRHETTSDATATSISMPVKNGDGDVELGVIVHVPHDGFDRGDAQDLARQVRSLIESASALVSGMR